MNIETKKETGLGDLLKEYTPQQLEDQKNVNGSSSLFSQTLLIYEDYLFNTPSFSHFHHHIRSLGSPRANFPLLIRWGADIAKVPSLEKTIEEAHLPTYTPAQLGIFLQATMRYETHVNYASATGIFLSMLVKKSYLEGHNHFTFNTQSLPQLSYLGSFLEGTKDNPVTISLRGNADSPAWGSAHVLVAIKGDASGYFGRGNNITYILHGNLRRWSCPTNMYSITFKTTVKRTMRTLLRKVPKGNKIYFIDRKRHETLEQDVHEGKEWEQTWKE